MKDALVIATIQRIGDDIIALADYLAACTKEEQNSIEEPAKPVSVESPKTPAIKLEDVRTALAELSRSGKTAQMKELLGRFGASKLSDVKPEAYADLLAAAKEVKNA